MDSEIIQIDGWDCIDTQDGELSYINAQRNRRLVVTEAEFADRDGYLADLWTTDHTHGKKHHLGQTAAFDVVSLRTRVNTLIYRAEDDGIRADGGGRSTLAQATLSRDDDRLRARHYHGSGIGEPDEPLVSILRQPDDRSPMVAGYTTLRVPAGELDDYIEVLQALRDSMDEGE